MDIQNIRKLVFQGKYEFSKHAERERELDMIYVWELEDALSNCEIIENYPDDSRGASCLVVGFCEAKPVHAVCTILIPKNCCSLLFMTRLSGLKSGQNITKRGGNFA